MSSKTYPQIPTARADIASLVTTVNTLKAVVETIIGVRAVAGTLHATTISATPPTDPKSGDAWVTLVGKIYFWNGKQWIAGSTA